MHSKSINTAQDFPTKSCAHAIAHGGTWVGRVWVPSAAAANEIAGPRVVLVRGDDVADASALYPTLADLVSADDPVEALHAAADQLPTLVDLETLFQNSLFFRRGQSLEKEQAIVLLAPNDLLATRACGVTFVRSLLERVVEEKAKGDPQKAREIRELIHASIGDDLSRIVPGSPATRDLKQRLIEQGLWSQYLEVGIGPDAEIFTKCQPMASIGWGAQIGVLPDSSWNNPEPEVVLAVSSRGRIVGATLGNDVNLRDYEGRSALLLGEAKDQNGSCAIGPFVRLFDQSFSLADVEQAEVTLTITGEDGFTTCGTNRMAEISRSPADLVRRAIGEHHQYPDGLMLFLGTMFAPSDDRESEGQGFTHHLGDRVEISSPKLGSLVNWVHHTNAIPRWEFGIRELIRYLKQS